MVLQGNRPDNWGQWGVVDTEEKKPVKIVVDTEEKKPVKIVVDTKEKKPVKIVVDTEEKKPVKIAPFDLSRTCSFCGAVGFVRDDDDGGTTCTSCGRGLMPHFS